MDVDDETEALARSYRRKRLIGTVLGTSILCVSCWAGWAYWLRQPSPEATCGSIAGLLEGTAVGDEQSAQVLLAEKVAGFELKSPEAEAMFSGACEAYFVALDEDNIDESDRVGQLTRCLTTSWSAVAAVECFDNPKLYVAAARRAAASYVRDQAASKDGGAPLSSPPGLEANVRALEKVADAALAGCDALLDLEEGCYTYTWNGDVENLRELGKPIPGPVPTRDDGLLLLEVSCSFDAAAWVERHPELAESVKAAPIPVQRLGCNYLATGDFKAAKACRSYVEPPEGDGWPGPGEDVSVWVPDDPGCHGREVRVEFERSDEEGRAVEVTALFRGARDSGAADGS